jgi:hypothetical protein
MASPHLQADQYMDVENFPALQKPSAEKHNVPARSDSSRQMMSLKAIASELRSPMSKNS